MFSQLSSGISTIVDGFWKIVSVVSDTLSSQASSKKEQNPAEHQQFLQDFENKKKAVNDLKLLQQEKLAAVNALVASAKATQQELGNATLLVDKKLNEKQSFIQSAEELSPQINRLSVEKRRQERKVADLTLKIAMKEMTAKEAESLKPSEHFQQLLNNAKLIEQRDYKQKLVIKPKSKQDILEDKKKTLEDLKLQQKNKLETLNALALAANSEIKQQELGKAILAVKQKSAEKQFLTGKSERLSAQVNSLSIEKQIEERKIADLTLRIEMKEMAAKEAEFLKPSEHFQQFLSNAKLIGQKNYKQKPGYEPREDAILEEAMVEPEVAIFSEQPIEQSQTCVFTAPENSTPNKNNARVIFATAASFREPRDRKQTDFFADFAKPKNKKNKNK